jgi:hypothetical protein
VVRASKEKLNITNLLISLTIQVKYNQCNEHVVFALHVPEELGLISNKYNMRSDVCIRKSITSIHLIISLSLLRRIKLFPKENKISDIELSFVVTDVIC